jgi:serine protease Do
VVINEVSPKSSAAERGLKPGDVIVEVQQGEVTSPADVQKKVDSVRKESRKSVLMLIQRQDGLQWVPLSLSADKDKQPG